MLPPETDNFPSWISVENDHRKYFMINLYERMLPDTVGIDPATPDHQSNAQVDI